MSDLSLLSREYRGVRRVSGPLLFVESASDLPYACTVSITNPSGPPRNGQVIEVSDDVTVVQVFEDTMGLDVLRTSVSLVDREARLGAAVDEVRGKYGFGSVLTMREKMLDAIYAFERKRGFVLKTASLTR